MQKLLLSAGVAALLAAGPALADENGNPVSKGYPCADSTISTIIAVCKAVQMAFPAVSCDLPPAGCSKERQEIFTGLTTEPAQPGVMGPWNGQGASGEVFQTVGLCLMRDLAFTPMNAPAKAQLPLGEIRANSLVSYRSFNPKDRYFEGYHRLTAHAPVIGDIDIMTQEFSARAVSKDFTGAGALVGTYKVISSKALDFEADKGAEGFEFELDAITIHTPYGTVTPKPHLSISRSSGWSLSPYGGASTTLLNPGGFKTTDAYGRLKGQQIASVQQVIGIVPEPKNRLMRSKFCGFIFKDVSSCLVPTPSGWTSQTMLGARNVDLKHAPWTAPAGDPFPARPDADVKMSRGQAEKNANGSASAGIKIEYSPIGMIPDAVLASGLIKPTIKVFADPNISVNYGSQFNFWNGQVGTWNPALTQPNAQPGTLLDVESLHSMALYSAASVGGRFAVDAGVDLVLHFHLSLPWPLDSIDFNIVDAHPRSAFLETSDAGTEAAPQGAFVLSDWQHAFKTGQIFKLFKPLGGGTIDGVAYLDKCLKESAPPKQTIPPVNYTKGDPEDLLEFLDLPCNICAGFADFTYVDVKSKEPLVFVTKTIKGVAGKTEPLVDDSVLPPADRWICGGEAPAAPSLLAVGPAFPTSIKTKEDANKYNEAAKAKAKPGVKNLGCYDQCRVNKETGKFELIMSAKQLWAANIIKDAPNGCH